MAALFGKKLWHALCSVDALSSHGDFARHLVFDVDFLRASSARHSGSSRASVAGYTYTSASLECTFARNADVLGWKDKAISKAESVGNSFQTRDGGPSSAELKREVDWLLDDAIEAEASVLSPPRSVPSDDIDAITAWLSAGKSHGGMAGSIRWQRTSWEAVRRQQGLLRRQHQVLAITATPNAATPNSSSGHSAAPAGGPVAAAVTHAGPAAAPPCPAPPSFPASAAALAPAPSPPPPAHLHLLRLRTSLASLDALWCARLERRVPFQYLVGAAHWRDLVLAVRPGVLIPRPETEMLVDLVERQLERDPPLASGAWADVGTGSGALAIALAKLLVSKRPQGGSDAPFSVQGPSPVVWAVDISPEAAVVACTNVRRCGVEGMVRVCQGSWLEPLIVELGPASLSGIMSNPPYIPSPDMPHLQQEVRCHEPALALDGGGEDGLASIRELLSSAAQALRPGGFLALETNGDAQCQALKTLLLAKGTWNRCDMRDGLVDRDTSVAKDPWFTDVTIVADLNDIPRFVTARRSG
eukprot:jgi/Mesvir1/12641/Mv02196-RA.1